MFDLRGRNVLLTGATGGIGVAIADVFIRAGARIALSSADIDILSAMCDRLGREFVVPVQCDLFDFSQLDVLYDNSETALGGEIDILICNAGIIRDNLMMRMKQEEWDDVLKVNLTSVFKLNQRAIRKMLSRRYGRIINISSIIGYTGNIGQANYAAAKAGMIGMSKSLAQECASRNITVNCIAPGFIDTPMTAKLSTDVKNTILAKIPMNRMGTPSEVAHAALFLASSESSYITGSVIHVNGGMYM